MVQDQEKLNKLNDQILTKFLYVKDLFGSHYQLLINEWKKVAIKKLKNPKTFIDYSQKIDDVYENLEDYKPTKKQL